MAKKLQTALITGPTSGIGKAFAQELARKGYHLLLVSRSKEIMAEMCQDLGEKHGINARYLVADLSQPSHAEQVFEESQALGIEIDLLVNNAGTHKYGPFVKADWDNLAS
ncbi:MAG: SDR family NAD(P)-dependent oxidoreductase, partial [Brevefilum sp.]